jgi:hypothetical protein
VRPRDAPITADEIAVQAMKDKNLDMSDGALRQDITRRFMWTLTRMFKTGGVSKQGWGADAKSKCAVSASSGFWR